MKQLDRLSIRTETESILNVNVRSVTLPVAVGRNLAVLVEAAVRNYICSCAAKTVRANFWNAIRRNLKKTNRIMKIVLISGLSGSGKSVALRQMEDLGYFCVDNLPLEMLPSLVSYHIERADETELAVSVDVRSGIDIAQAREQIAYLRGLGHRVEVLFVEAEDTVLIRRFSETRRGHPLSNQDMTLLESLKKSANGCSRLRKSPTVSTLPR